MTKVYFASQLSNFYLISRNIATLYNKRKNSKKLSHNFLFFRSQKTNLCSDYWHFSNSASTIFQVRMIFLLFDQKLTKTFKIQSTNSKCQLLNNRRKACFQILNRFRIKYEYYRIQFNLQWILRLIDLKASFVNY